MEQNSNSSPWSARSTRERCRIVASVAGQIAAATEEFKRLSANDQRREAIETVTAELLPFCSALRWVGRRGAKVLADRRCGWLGRPAWLLGVSSFVRRWPHGRVLVLGTWNYPILLTGVQTAQALAAGNRVLLKPAVGCEAITARLVRAFYDAGVPSDALVQLDSSADSAVAAMNDGVELVVLTGSAATGRKVLAKAAATLTPAIMELSGCDAVVVMPDADIEKVARAIVFGLTINGGATCIGPRRLIAENETADRLLDALRTILIQTNDFKIHPSAIASTAEVLERSIESGCRVVLGKFEAAQFRQTGMMPAMVLDNVAAHHSVATEDIFAPVTSIMRVGQIDEAIELVNECPYRLGASVFGIRAAAMQMAERLSVGSVCVNDLIVPTADPRLPFGGRGQSGFGVTRGEEGLLAMTVAKVISVRRGSWMPHLQMRGESDERRLSQLVSVLHGQTIAERWRALRAMIKRE